MQIFTQEYKEALIAEHKLINASLLRMTSTAAISGMYANRQGLEIFNMTKNNLLSKKLELEIKIDELIDFLDK